MAGSNHKFNSGGVRVEVRTVYITFMNGDQLEYKATEEEILKAISDWYKGERWITLETEMVTTIDDKGEKWIKEITLV
jgi:hypothetical protein